MRFFRSRYAPSQLNEFSRCKHNVFSFLAWAAVQCHSNWLRLQTLNIVWKLLATRDQHKITSIISFFFIIIFFSVASKIHFAAFSLAFLRFCQWIFFTQNQKPILFNTFSAFFFLFYCSIRTAFVRFNMLLLQECILTVIKFFPVIARVLIFSFLSIFSSNSINIGLENLLS